MENTHTTVVVEKDKWVEIATLHDQSGSATLGLVPIENIPMLIEGLKKFIGFNVPVMLSNWQACPKCNGQGIMNKPPYVAGDQQGWTSGQMSHTCDVCNGKKIISIMNGKPPANY